MTNTLHTTPKAAPAVVRGGTSTLGLLGLLFVGLKLGGVIGWSWWLVLLPFYAGIAIALVVMFVGLVVLGVVSMLDNQESKKRQARNANLRAGRW